MTEPLKTFQEVVQYIAKKYNMPEEIVEEILLEWQKIIWLFMTGKNLDDVPPLLR